MVRKRNTAANMSPESSRSAVPMDQDGPRAKDVAGDAAAGSRWLFFAIASGACAAFNGVFAKLTTTELTTTLSNNIAHLLGMNGSYEKVVEFVIRAIFFILNLTFNGIMWSLFTTALARGRSATQVSIMNTSTNFLVTAVMGMAIFSESLPPMWWAGASLLVTGSVIAGRKDEGETDAGPSSDAGSGAGAGETYAMVPGGEGGAVLGDGALYRDDADEDVPHLGEPQS